MARIGVEESLDGQVHGVDFLGRIGQRRVEVPQQAAGILLGDFPDAEESEDVVDAEGVEVAAHLPEARLPPGEVVLAHLLPVVGREAPVLPVGAEEVGRGARRGVEVEELRVPVGFGAVGAHPDGQVAFEGNALGARIVHFLAELLVQVVLHPAVVFRLQPVAPGAEFGIFFQPVGVLLDEFLVRGGGAVLDAARFECAPDIGHLGLEHTRIIQLRQGVQLRLLLLESGIGLDPEILQVDVERVQREG
jgi:hypothetical protein